MLPPPWRTAHVTNMFIEYEYSSILFYKFIFDTNNCNVKLRLMLEIARHDNNDTRVRLVERLVGVVMMLLFRQSLFSCLSFFKLLILPLHLISAYFHLQQ